MKTFPWAWTSFPVEPQNGIARTAKGARYGSGIVRLFYPPVYPKNTVISASVGMSLGT
jgi:hypothetical protein